MLHTLPIRISLNTFVVIVLKSTARFDGICIRFNNGLTVNVLWISISNGYTWVENNLLKLKIISCVCHCRNIVIQFAPELCFQFINVMLMICRCNLYFVLIKSKISNNIRRPITTRMRANELSNRARPLSNGLLFLHYVLWFLWVGNNQLCHRKRFSPKWGTIDFSVVLSSHWDTLTCMSQFLPIFLSKLTKVIYNLYNPLHSFFDKAIFLFIFK